VTYTFNVTAQPWHAERACHDVPPSVFYIEQFEGSYRRARTICAACPVSTECLQWALTGGPDGTGEHDGMWAGTTPRERQEMRMNAAPRRKRTHAVCGTSSGYSKHYRNGEKPCDACRAAWSADDRERQARRRAERAA
jgi:WhiB family redox-sensing transcriptional regulator